MGATRGAIYRAPFFHYLLRLAIIAAISAGISLAQPQSTPDNSLAKSRAQHLRHGINMSEWFAQVHDPKGYTKEHFETWNTPADAALIKSIGFDHVRLSVNPGPIFHRNQADQIPADYLAEIDLAIKMLLDQNLAVVLDIHPDEDFKQKLASDETVEQFTDFWRAFAKHFSAYDPGKVFFEALNEPEMRDRYRWYGIQIRLVGAIREAAPQHTILVEGARWANDDDLIFLEPLRDTNIIYNFHFYEPHIFTHQGATWGVNSWHYLKGLPYPSDPDNVRATAATVPDDYNRLLIMRYGADRWNLARINVDFDQVATWARHWNVPVVCNEFGVFRYAAKPEDRAAWLKDVRSSLEKHNFGWTMWDYSGGFGVITKSPNQPTQVDPLTVSALGLHVPEQAH
jgi:endoglucanase